VVVAELIMEVIAPDAGTTAAAVQAVAIN